MRRRFAEEKRFEAVNKRAQKVKSDEFFVEGNAARDGATGRVGDIG